MRFTLSIEMGNAAMESATDLVDALQHVVGQLESDPLESGHAQSIRDHNGNRVGQWKIRED